MDFRWPISNFQSLLESDVGFLEKDFRDHEPMAMFPKTPTMGGEDGCPEGAGEAERKDRGAVW